MSGRSHSPREPAYRLPPRSCDAHCHVFGPADAFPYAEGRRYTPEDSPDAALTALHRRLGIERAVIVQAACHGTDNRAMLAAVAADPERRRGVALVDAHGVDERGLRALHEGGVRGIRLNYVGAVATLPTRSGALRTAAICRDLGWHVLVHCSRGSLEPLAPLLRTLDATLVLDHMGRVDAAAGLDSPGVRALLELARRDNVWVKVSGADRVGPPPFSAATALARALAQIAPERLLWGTDFPHPNAEFPTADEDLVDLIPDLLPGDGLQHRVLVDNPAALYGF